MAKALQTCTAPKRSKSLISGTKKVKTCQLIKKVTVVTPKLKFKLLLRLATRVQSTDCFTRDKFQQTILESSTQPCTRTQARKGSAIRSTVTRCSLLSLDPTHQTTRQTRLLANNLCRESSRIKQCLARTTGNSLIRPAVGGSMPRLKH